MRILSSFPLLRLCLSMGLGIVGLPAHADVAVQNAWARATVPTQGASGVFMRLRSDDAATLVGIDSPLAGIAEIHEMRMQGSTMSMRAIKTLPLPAGRWIELSPGGYHVMLLDLKKKPLKAGETIPLKLKIQNADGQIVVHDVTAEVRGLAHAGRPH
ncbi:MAG: copper chaperone PCu(A)C [Burkholderiaceae bacterium]|jgi:copper(I)-binding protein